MALGNRRTFVLRLVASGAAALATSRGHAQAGGPKLEESDPQAVALGYKHDTRKVDDKKYPNHSPAQDCANCQLYQGKAKEATGPCTLFPGKQVAAAGWCSAWNKKAG